MRCVRKPSESGVETAPTDCASIGNTCSDGTVFAGYQPTLGDTTIGTLTVKMYTTAADQSGAINYASGGVNTQADSDYNGKANQAWINYNSTIGDYPAMQACQILTTGGHNDWYLPARYELNVLYTNRAAIGGFGTNTYWSSTESGTSNARRQNFNTGSSGTSAKTTATYSIRCVRKDDFN